MKFFKLPIVVTAVILPLMFIVGVAGMIWIGTLDISNRKKEGRAAALGSAVATIGCVAMAPFWLVAAARFGKDLRQKKLGR